MSWLDEHLETFVRPVLKTIPDIRKGHTEVDRWTPKLILALATVWKVAKIRSNGRKILLAGRDVWQFEMLARMENYPTIFRPDISGPVARDGHVKEDYTECYLLDTGYAGTVPTALKMVYYDLISLRPEMGTWMPRYYHQVFPKAIMYPKLPDGTTTYAPTRTGTLLNLSIALESSYKYWFPGRYSFAENKIFLDQSSLSEFTDAARGTIHISLEITRRGLL